MMVSKHPRRASGILPFSSRNTLLSLFIGPAQIVCASIVYGVKSHPPRTPCKKILNARSNVISPDSKRVEGWNEGGVAGLPGMYRVPAGESSKIAVVLCLESWRVRNLLPHRILRDGNLPESITVSIITMGVC